MRTQTILVTRRCNQACGFCARVAHESADPSLATLHAAIKAAVAGGAGTLVFSGGEPTLRPDLYALVRLARAEGAKSVAIETNATRLGSPQAARALRTVGVDAVRVSVVTADPAEHRSLVGAGTTPAQVLAGVRACLEAGLAVSVRLPLAVGLPSAASRLAWIHEAAPEVRRFELAAALPGEAALRPGFVLSREALTAELTEAWQAGSRRKLTVALAPEQPLPPCTVDVKGGARRLFAGMLRDEAGEPARAGEVCGSCALAPRCVIRAAQLSRAASDASGASRAVPIDDVAGWLHPGRNPGSRMRVLGADDVEQFFHVHYDFGEAEMGRATARVGIIYRCNQVCTFCELADMDTQVAPEKVRAAIDESAARGAYRLIVTGGEPTLSPNLAGYVRHAREKGFVEIEMQTNAVLLDRPGAAEELREAGLTSAQVSLHGPDGEVSDRLTAAPGTHARTLRGIDRLLENGVVVLLNHLVFKDNCHLLVDFVEMVESRWGAHRERLILQFHSARNEFPDRDEALRHVARYTEYVETLRLAIDRARSLGYETYDLQHPTGIPSLCVLGADVHYLGPIFRQAQVPRAHAWEQGWFTRVAACERCEVADACSGVPKHYLKLHGDGEFRPMTRASVTIGEATPRPADSYRLRKA